MSQTEVSREDAEKASPCAVCGSATCSQREAVIACQQRLMGAAPTVGALLHDALDAPPCAEIVIEGTLAVRCDRTIAMPIVNEVVS